MPTILSTCLQMCSRSNGKVGLCDLDSPGPPDVVAAWNRVRNRVHLTPILTSSTISRLVGRDVYFKCENLQRTGSYKIRGAVNQVVAHHDSMGKLLLGVVAASSGNHGQAVACIARDIGLPARIVVPSSINATKRAAIVEYGGTVIEAESAWDKMYIDARRIAEANGYLEIPPFDHPLTVAGQGTCAFEALTQQIEDIEAIVCPVGGGGLAAGTVLGTLAAGSDAKVYAAEPSNADDTAQSFRAGHRVELRAVETMADALLAPIPGELTFAINVRGLSDVLCVTEEEILAAMRFIWERMKLVVEPSAAVPVASLLNGSVPGDGPVLIILSGGNSEFANP